MELWTFRNYTFPCISVSLYYFLEGYVRRGVDWLVMTLPLWGLGRLGGCPLLWPPRRFRLAVLRNPPVTPAGETHVGDWNELMIWCLPGWTQPSIEILDHILDQTPWKFKSSQLKILYRAPEGNFISQPSFFRCYVKLRECNSLITWCMLL